MARTGRMEVSEEWSARFDQNAGDAEGRKGKAAYFIPVKKGDRVLARLPGEKFAVETAADGPQALAAFAPGSSPRP